HHARGRTDPAARDRVLPRGGDLRAGATRERRRSADVEPASARRAAGQGLPADVRRVRGGAQGSQLAKRIRAGDARAGGTLTTLVLLAPYDQVLLSARRWSVQHSSRV